MRAMDDRELLQAYARDRSEAAFGELARLSGFEGGRVHKCLQIKEPTF